MTERNTDSFIFTSAPYANAAQRTTQYDVLRVYD